MAAASAATAPTVAVSAPTAAPAPIRLLVNYAAVGPSQSGLWAAYEGGYLREQGLDGELTNVPNTARAVQAMMQGDVDISMMEPATAIQISLSGADTVLLFGSVNRLLYSVMSQPAITDPQMMRGRVLGITRIGSATHSAARVALQDWGLAPDRDVALRQLGENTAVYAALDAGQIDAGMMTSPFNIRARREGFYELADLSRQGPDYVSLAVGGLRSWVGANDEALRRFARAYAQAIYRLKTDRPWALGVWRKYMQTDDEQLLDDSYDVYRDNFPLPPYVSEAGLARLLEDLVADDPRLVGRPATDWVDGRFVRELETSGFMRQLTGQ
ncbi:MAG TPA: ABC transporter substrate-binding protein [Chloroflexota bacterium]|nr:ABC transporter substrate-binding protein [Chloroflexota bacterium]